MASVNLPSDYAAKQKRLKDAINHIQPDQVPILFLTSTWGYSYTKTNISEVLYNQEKLTDGYIDVLKDIYSDAVIGGTLNAPMKLYDVLKPERPQYLISDDGYSLQHMECAVMMEDEYPQLIDNPKRFIENVLLPRRYPVLTRPYPENYEALKKAYTAAMDFISGMQYSAERLKTKYGVPAIINGAGFMPADYVLDFMRGFRGITRDMRKHQDELVDACDRLADYVIAQHLATANKESILFFPLHLPPFLSPQQFEKFYWPSFKKVVEYATVKKQAKLLLALEGDWTPYADCLMEFPKNSLLCHIDRADIKDFKRKYGDKLTLIGGLDSVIVRDGTKEECIEMTKKLLDVCAPGGGFMAATNNVLICPGDINIENYMACVDVIRSYK